MVNSLSNSSSSAHSLSQKSSGSKTPSPSDTKTKEVGKSWFQKAANAFHKNVTHKVVAATADFVLDSVLKDDREYLLKLTGEDVSAQIKTIAPKLPEVLQKLAPGIASFAENQKDSTEKIAETLILHTIRGLAESQYPNFDPKKDQPAVSLEQLTQEITSSLIKFFKEELDAVDKTIHTKDDITADKFEPMANKLLKWLFPPNKSYFHKKIAQYVSKDLTEGMMEMYKPFGIWFTGGKLEFGNPVFQDFLPILEQFGAYTIDCMADHHKEDDKELLQKLTKSDDIQQLVELLTPQALGGILASDKAKELLAKFSDYDAAGIVERNGDTIDNAGTAVILKIIANISRELFAEEIKNKEVIPVNEFITEFALGISDIFGAYIHEINKMPNPTAKDFQPIAEHLLQFVLPKDPLVQGFLVRRKDCLTKDLSVVIQKSYMSIAPRNDTEEYKQRLRELLWNKDELEKKNNTGQPLPDVPTVDLSIKFGIEKLVDQFYNICCNTTNIGRGFVATRFSDPEVLEKQINTTYTTLTKQALPQGLATGVAEGISQLILEGHEVSDPQVIVECLKGIDPSLTDPLIAEIADLVKALSKKSTLSDSKVVIEQLDSNKQFQTLDQNVKKKAADAIIATMYANNPLYWLTPTIQNALQLTLFKGLVHLLEKVKPEKRNRNELFPAALQIILKKSTKELQVITKGVKTLSDKNSPNFVADDNERNNQIKLLMDPFVDKLIATFYEDKGPNGAKKLEDHLPLPDEIKPFVAGLIRDNAYQIILPMIEASTSWMDAKEENKARLDAVFGNTHASEACRLGGAMASQSIPYCLQEFHETLADSVSENLAFLFASQSGNVPTKKELKPLRKMINHTLISLSENETDPMKSLLKFVQHFSESALLRGFADLAECLAKLDEEHKDDPEGSLPVQGTTIVLDELQQHLTLISELKSELNQYNVDKIPQQKLVDKFQNAGHLHPAVTSQANQDAFFVDLSKKFLGIVGVGKEVNLPIPEFLKEPLWDLFEESLMPMLLLRIIDQVKDPHTLNLVLIGLFQEINEAAGNVDVSIPDDEIRKWKDAPQDQIEEIAGKLIYALVCMQRSSITKWALKNPKMQRLAGQAMGQSLREYLEGRSLITLVDELVARLIPIMHPGKWDNTGHYKCIKVDGKKKIEIQEPDFSHMFPMTDDAKAKYKKIKDKEVKQAQKDVVKEITHGIENQTKYIILGFFRKLWRSFRKALNKTIDKVFGSYAPKIKATMNKILDGIADYLIKPVLFVTAYPVLYIVKRLLRFYFVFQSSLRAKDVNFDHKNVVYRVLDGVLDLVSNAKKSQAATTNSSATTQGSPVTTVVDTEEEVAL